MLKTPLVALSIYLKQRNDIDSLELLLKKFLPQSKNVELWLFYISCIKEKIFLRNQNKNEKDKSEEYVDTVTKAYEYALNNLIHNPDITLVFTGYISHLKKNYEFSLIIDRIRSGYHLVLKQPIIRQSHVLAEYEKFENDLNKNSAKTILEKLNVSKLTKKLGYWFDMEKPVSSQLNVYNFNYLYDCLTGEDETKVVDFMVKDIIYWNEELWYKIISSEENKTSLVEESIIVNTFFDDKECFIKKEKKIMNNNFFFILMGNYFNQLDLKVYIFKEKVLDKIDKIGHSDENIKITLLDLNPSFLMLKRRQKDLIFIHLLSTHAKSMPVTSNHKFFYSILDLIGPLVFFHYAKILFYNSGKINYFINIMLLGIKLTSAIEQKEEHQDSKIETSQFTLVLQKYLIKFLYESGQIDESAKWSNIFTNSIEDLKYKYCTITSTNELKNEKTQNIEMYNYYFSDKVNYNGFIIASNNRDILKKKNNFNQFIQLMGYDVLKPLKHENILSLMEEMEDTEWLDECELGISVYEIKKILNKIRN